MNPRVSTPLLLVSLTLLSGCATFRSDLGGRFEGSTPVDSGAEDVSVLFVLRHVKQAKGLDEIPKLQSERQIVRDFDNVFQDAMSELGNVSRYATFTEFPSDVSKPERTARRDELISQYDFVCRITITREHSFIRHFLGGVATGLSVTVLPVPYSRSYSMEVEVQSPSGESLARYQREATLTSWVQTFLIFLQPFHNETIKQEQIYIDFLHDTFRQIHAEQILISRP